MLPTSCQEALDHYIEGKIDENQLLEKVDWKKTWGYAWSLYRPLFTFARDNHLPIIALNTPRKLIRAVSQRGLEGLTPTERALLPETIDTTLHSHRERFERNTSGHPPHPHADPQRMYEAMCVWDETMASSVSRFLVARPGWRLVVLAGSGHIAHFDGIPQRAIRRIPHRAHIILPIEIRRPLDLLEMLADPPGDHVLFTPRSPAKKRPKVKSQE